jgi:hypothetical protein
MKKDVPDTIIRIPDDTGPIAEYIQYKIGVWDGYYHNEIIECLNDICKEISAFGEHNKK